MGPTRCYWVKEAAAHRLVLMPRPRSGEWLGEEIAGWREAGFNTVLSLLESLEVGELGLREERALCEANGIEFVSFPIPDRGIPASIPSAVKVVEHLVSRLRSGKVVAIHCRAGIGRAGILSACVLLRLGVPIDRVFPSLSRSRGVPVPDTTEQIRWVENYARKVGSAP